MKFFFSLFFIGLSYGICSAQSKGSTSIIVQDRDSLQSPSTDSIQGYTIEEIVIDLAQENYKKDMIILRNRLRRVYPYARATADNLLVLNENLAKIDNNTEKRRYIKRSQKYLEGQFKEKLKRLSRNDGKILLKLIDRQTGQTAFSLIKEFKSGWTAFWSNTTAKTFSLNLKSQYRPYEDMEDFFIETQLQFLFFSYQLEYSSAVPSVEYTKLLEFWQKKVDETIFFPTELRE
ncbi:DUF4294 domain-containing protein [Myroides sp. LJL115]